MTYLDKLARFAYLIETHQREVYARRFPTLDLPRATIVTGKKYARVDVGGSGKYMVDADGNIYGIKAYGVIHRGKRYGTLDTVEDWYWGDYVGIPKRRD